MLRAVGNTWVDAVRMCADETMAGTSFLETRYSLLMALKVLRKAVFIR